MLTPQEVSERSFTKATFGGYHMVQVDEFLDVLTQDYAALYNENAVLKSKLKVLVDKVEEYRSTEEAMRRALRAAQKQSDELVAEAQQEKARIIEETEARAKSQMDEVAKALAAEEFRLKQAQETTAAFVAQVQALNAKQAEYLASIGELCPSEEAAKVEDTAAAIDSSMQHILAQDAQQAPEEPQDLDATTEFTPVTEEPQEASETPEEPQTEESAEEEKPRYDIHFVPFKQEDEQDQQ